MTRRRFALGILVVAALGGCASVPVAPTPMPILPSPPAYVGCPAKVGPPRVGEDARAYAAREHVGRVIANRCFDDAQAFYADVRAKLGGADAP